MELSLFLAQKQGLPGKNAQNSRFLWFFLLIFHIFTINGLYCRAEFADDVMRDSCIKNRDLGRFGCFFCGSRIF
jgi:hypothetical protein